VNETQRKAFKTLLKMAISLLHACMWHSMFQSAVTSQQGQGWHLVSTKGGSSVQPKRRRKIFPSHLRNILGKFSALMFVMVFRYCLSKLPNGTVSNTVLHSLALKKSFALWERHKVGMVC